MFVHFALPDESPEFDRPQGLLIGNSVVRATSPSVR
jgi:hypothetical protein